MGCDMVETGQCWSLVVGWGQREQMNYEGGQIRNWSYVRARLCCVYGQVCDRVEYNRAEDISLFIFRVVCIKVTDGVGHDGSTGLVNGTLGVQEDRVGIPWHHPHTPSMRQGSITHPCHPLWYIQAGTSTKVSCSLLRAPSRTDMGKILAAAHIAATKAET